MRKSSLTQARQGGFEGDTSTMLTLIIEADGEPPRTAKIEQFPCRIGRHRGAEVVLASWRVARWHAEIHRLQSGYRLLDLGSIGGTWVNGERIVEYAPLAEVDEIVIAGYRLRAIPVGPADATDAAIVASVADSMAAAKANSPPDLMPDSVSNAVSNAVPHSTTDSMLASTAAACATATPEGTDEAAEPAHDPREARPTVAPATGSATALATVATQAALEWRRLLHRRLLQTIDLRRKDVRQLSSEQLRADARKVLQELIAQDLQRPTGVDVERAIGDVLDEAIGLGPLERLLADPEVSEIMVNRADEIYVERHGRLARSALAFSGEHAVRAVIDRIVAPLGRRIDESSPMVDARLPDGSRVNAVIPPLAVRGSVVTIRRFNRQLLAPADLLRLASASPAMLRFLRLCVEHRRNVVISGGTGSGKTTLLNVLSNLIPPGERVVTIEDAAELRLRHAHLVSLEARPANAEGRGGVGIRDLVCNALRMRPDRIVVGECRGGEALDMLQAMNTGHEGSLTTVHANSPRDVIARLETMVLMAGMDLPIASIRDQIASAVHVIVQQARGSDGVRRIVEIAEVTGIEAGRVQMQPLFRWERGRFVACDTVPQFLEELRAEGVAVDWAKVAESA